MKSAQTLRGLMMGGGYTPLGIAGLLFFNSYNDVVQTNAISQDSSGPAFRSISSAGGSVYSCANALGANNAAYHGGTITLTNYVNAGNNGVFTATAGTTVNTDYVNASGVAEAVGVGVGAQVAAVTGYCNSYTDLVAGRVFSQATAASCFSVNTNIISGKSIIGQLNVRTRGLSINSSALAGQLNGTGDFTLFTYMRPTAVNASGTTSSWMAFQDTTPTSLISAKYGAATAHTLTITNGAGSSSNHTATLSPGLTLDTWQLLAVTYNGSTGVAQWYINGVLAGTSATFTIRTRASLANVFIGYRSTYPSGSGGTTGHRAVDAAVSRAMTAHELLRLTAWCQGEYA
jgi:hypothetical protein